jgi:hypothetical protein
MYCCTYCLLQEIRKEKASVEKAAPVKDGVSEEDQSRLSNERHQMAEDRERMGEERHDLMDKIKQLEAEVTRLAKVNAYFCVCAQCGMCLFVCCVC